MSLREKAREVKAAGEAERGNFTPTGAPKRLYNYWLNNASRKNTYDLRMGLKKENFCHFWRVVLIWAPFLALRRGIENLFTNPIFLVLIGIAAIVAIIWVGATWTEVGKGVLLALGLLYGAAGLLFGGIYAHDKYEAEHYKPYVYYDGTTDPGDVKVIDKELRLCALITFATSWLTYSIVSVAKRIPADTRKLLGYGIVGLFCAGAAVTLLVLALIDFGFWTFAYIGGFIVAVVALVALVVAAGTLFESLRAYTRKKSAERSAKAAANPKPEKVVEPREPGIVSRFFTAVADFLILAAQVVRVKKWKICPLVEINDERPPVAP